MSELQEYGPCREIGNAEDEILERLGKTPRFR